VKIRGIEPLLSCLKASVGDDVLRLVTRALST
jgi:hypothetical protein